MKKAATMIMVAALAVAVCVSGCKPKGGEAKKDEGKAAPGAAATQGQAPATSGAAAFGDEICKMVENDPNSIGMLMSLKFMTLSEMTSQQEKAMPKDQLEKMLKSSDEAMKKSTPPDPKAEKPKDCKVVEAKDISCDELYTKIDTEGMMGTKPPKGRAKEIGDSMKLEGCGLLTLTAKDKGKDEPISFGTAKVDGKNAVVSLFVVKAATK